MKKICLALILSLAMLCMHSVIAVAETGQYTAGVNSYTNSESNGARTVLIYRGVKGDKITADNIYYINQSDSEDGFSNLEMLMKRDAPAGFYTFVTDIDGKFATFEISEAQAAVAGNEEMTYLGAEKKGGSYSVAYGISTTTVTETSKISMLLDGKLYATDLFGNDSIIKWVFGPISVGGKLAFAIQIDGVGEEYVYNDGAGNVTPDFKLYFK